MIDEDVLSPKMEDPKSAFRLGTITAIKPQGTTVKFEGEDTASDKAYTVVQTYTPTVSDRVVLLNISGTYVVLGSVGPPKTKTDYILASEKGSVNGVATLNADGKVVQTVLNADNASWSNTASKLESVGSLAYLSSNADITSTVNKVNNIIGKMISSGMLD